MLIDSDVFINVMRGKPQALAVFVKVPHIRLSAVTYIEVAQGSQNKTELARFKKMLTTAQADILAIEEDISLLACDLIDRYALSHGLQLGDALIAGTALVHNEPLLTGNVKHFSRIKGLQVEHFE